MKDFFTVMGKAFAVVFGSTSALALVLVLLVLAVRPLLRQLQVQRQPQAQAPVVVHNDEEVTTSTKPPPGYILDNPPFHDIVPIVTLENCSRDGCVAYSLTGHKRVAFIPRAEITKVQISKAQIPDFIPVKP